MAIALLQKHYSAETTKRKGWRIASREDRMFA
jgi:hypothetical protein